MDVPGQDLTKLVERLLLDVARLTGRSLSETRVRYGCDPEV